MAESQTNCLQEEVSNIEHNNRLTDGSLKCRADRPLQTLVSADYSLAGTNSSSSSSDLIAMKLYSSAFYIDFIWFPTTRADGRDSFH